MSRHFISRPRLRYRKLATATALLVLTALLGMGALPTRAQTYGPLTTLAGFTSVVGGAFPYAGVTLDNSGNLYGTTYGGGAGGDVAGGDGTVFKIAAGTNTPTTLVNFTGTANGGNPQGGVTIDSSGNLYGTTSVGGSSNYGTVFEIAVGTNTLSTLVTFTGTDYNGATPHAGLTLDANGNLYGTTGGSSVSSGSGSGGPNGSVFEITPTLGNTGRNFYTLATFTGSVNGGPYGGVTLDSSGNLYGTTVTGGPNERGSVFKIAAGSSTAAAVANFTATASGVFPYGSVTIDSNGNLYGTTYGGGSSGKGTVFKIAAGSNTITTLATFTGTVNGANPQAGLTIDSSGNLFGTTSAGGSSNDGTVFEIAAGTSTLTTLATFTGKANGANPYAGLTLDSNGTLYGTTSAGGTIGGGTVFKLSTSAYTDPYTGGITGTSIVPVSGNFSNGFFSILVPGGVGTTLQFAGTSYTATDDLTVIGTANSLTFSNSGAVVLQRGANPGAANQIALTTNTNTGATPTLVLNNTGSLTIAPDLALNAATAVSGSGSATISGAISGTSGLTKSGTGTLTLTGNNTNTGAWAVNAGTLALAGGTDSQSITVSSGATLALSGGVQYTIGGGYGILNAASGGTVTYSNATVNGGTIVGTGTQMIASGGATFNNVAVNTTSALAQNGALTMNSGSLQAALANNATLTMNNVLVTSKGSVTAAGGVTDAFSNVEVDGKMTIPSGAAVNNSGASLVLGGGSQTNIGTKTTSGGTLALGGQTLELNGGFLSNNGTISGGVVNINYGGLAKGAGNYAGGYSVNYGGKIIFGNSPGTLTSGGATWNGGSGLAFQIDDATGVAGVGWGNSVIDGALSLNASGSDKITIALSSLLPTGGDEDFGPLSNWDPNRNWSWDYVTASGGITGFDPSYFALDITGFAAYNATNGGRFTISEEGNDLMVRFNSVGSAAAPEPGALALLLGPGLAAGGLLLRRRLRAVR